MIISEHPLDKGNPIVVSPFITDNELDRITNYTEHLIKQKILSSLIFLSKLCLTKICFLEMWKEMMNLI